MIEIDEARSLVLSKCGLLAAESRRAVDAIGYVLASDVVADVDSPPHDKSLVDGYAIRFGDAGKQLRLLEQVVAGAVPQQKIEPGTTSHIMTGAPVPVGTEAIVMVEEVEHVGDDVRVPEKVKKGQHIMPQAATFAHDEIVLRTGTPVRPIEVGLLCEVGRNDISCTKKPTVAILPTGDELVPCTAVPAAGQIRNSNGPMLEALAVQDGCTANSLGVGKDNEPELRAQIEQGLDADILVLSGGVSAGVLDLVPPTLRSLGVQEVFHKVRLKPGKPLWFGYRDHGKRNTLVFGLPGNPISSLVCFELFVRPAIRVLSGHTAQVELQPVRLAESFQQRGNRPTYFPGISFQDGGRTFVRPLPWRGSADMLTVSQADCLIHFLAGEREYQAGERLMALPLR